MYILLSYKARETIFERNLTQVHQTLSSYFNDCFKYKNKYFFFEGYMTFLDELKDEDVHFTLSFQEIVVIAIGSVMENGKTCLLEV